MIQQKYLFTQRINIKLVLPITVHIVHCVHCTVYNEKRLEKEVHCTLYTIKIIPMRNPLVIKT